MNASSDDARKAMREMIDEFGRAADQAMRMMRQAAEDFGRWAGPTPTRHRAATEASSPTEAIRELGRLRDEGLITEDEYQAKKTQLLERI